MNTEKQTTQNKKLTTQNEQQCTSSSRLSELPNLGPYTYTTLKFQALEGAPYIHGISRLRVKEAFEHIPLKKVNL
jgi:hypothetical protein